MKTLIIYDNEGYIINSNYSGYPLPRKPIGVPYLEVEIPEGKKLIDGLVDGVRVPQVDVSVTPHKLILEDIPPTEMDLLRSENQALASTVDMILTDVIPSLMG